MTLTERPEWQSKGLCIGSAELFFDDMQRRQVAKAKRMCYVCPVQSACLDYALTADDFGVWGGMTQNERRKMKRATKRLMKSDQTCSE